MIPLQASEFADSGPRNSFADTALFDETSNPAEIIP